MDKVHNLVKSHQVAFIHLIRFINSLIYQDTNKKSLEELGQAKLLRKLLKNKTRDNNYPTLRFHNILKLLLI